MSKEGYFTHKGQHVMKSTTIMLNPKNLDNTGTGYLEFKGVV
jgi:hypothetical protein